MQIIGFKIRNALQLVRIQEGHSPVRPSDQPTFPQFLQGSVDMHDRNAARVRYILLRQRKMEAAFRDQTDGAEARCDFADEVCDAGECIARSDVAEPFAERGRFYDRLAPKYAPQIRRCGDQVLQIRMRNETNARAADADDRAIENRQVECLQVEEIAGHMEGEYLLPFGSRFVACQKAFMHDGALNGSIAGAAERFAIFEQTFSHSERFQQLAVARQEANVITDTFTEETGGHGWNCTDLRLGTTVEIRSNHAIGANVCC